MYDYGVTSCVKHLESRWFRLCIHRCTPCGFYTYALALAGLATSRAKSCCSILMHHQPILVLCWWLRCRRCCRLRRRDPTMTVGRWLLECVCVCACVWRWRTTRGTRAHVIHVTLAQWINARMIYDRVFFAFVFYISKSHLSVDHLSDGGNQRSHSMDVGQINSHQIHLNKGTESQDESMVIMLEPHYTCTTNKQLHTSTNPQPTKLQQYTLWVNHSISLFLPNIGHMRNKNKSDLNTNSGASFFLFYSQDLLFSLLNRTTN